MRFQLAVLATFMAFANLSANAAQIIRSTDSRCTIELNGEIQPDDTNAFEKMIESIDTPSNDQRDSAEPSEPTLCLNSPGGSFRAALGIIDLFPQNLRTLIRADHQCLSACALIFLNGRMYTGLPAHREQEGWGNLPDRWLSIKGQIGFHAPYSPIDGPGEKAYMAGVSAVAKLVAETAREEGSRFFPPDLLAEALKVGAGEFFKIEWVFQALHWNIRLADLQIDDTLLSNCNVARACHNFLWAKVIGIEPVKPKDEEDDTSWSGLDKESNLSPKKTNKLWHSQRIKFLKNRYTSPKLFRSLGRRGTYVCIVQLYRSDTNGLLVNIHRGDETSPPSVRSDQLEILESWQGRLSGESPAYLINPTARIQDLAKLNSQADLLKCEASSND